MNGERIFVDTNILIYAHDPTEGQSREVARGLVADLVREPHRAWVSTQVLMEFYVGLLRKGASDGVARETVADLLDWNVVEAGPNLVMFGIQLRERWRVSFWDAMILAAAMHAGARTLWTEDLNIGQDYGGVVAVNPLAE